MNHFKKNQQNQLAKYTLFSTYRKIKMQNHMFVTDVYRVHYKTSILRQNTSKMQTQDYNREEKSG